LLDEESKAVQEVAKTANKAIDAGREMGGFIAKYIAGPLEQAMGIWEDKLKYRRWENQIKLAEKARSALLARGLDGPTRTVELSIAIPLLEEASLADSDELQDRWAMLLANAADANGPEIRRAYIGILAEMTSFDALILDMIFEVEQTFLPTKEAPVAEIWTHLLPGEVRVLGQAKPPHDPVDLPLDVEISLGNLARLGLIASAMAFGGNALMSAVSMTGLGRQFVISCRPIR
jgi:hypothetical protein